MTSLINLLTTLIVLSPGTDRRPSAGPVSFRRTGDEGDLQAIPSDLGLGFEQRP